MVLEFLSTVGWVHTDTGLKHLFRAYLPTKGCPGGHPFHHVADMCKPLSFADALV